MSDADRTAAHRAVGSSADRVRLAAHLDHELATARIAWEAAVLRADDAVVRGDDVGAYRALDDQRAVLAGLEGAVARVVADAVTTRETSIAPGVVPEREAAVPPDGSVPTGSPSDDGGRVGRWLERAPALLGAAAAAVLAVAVVTLDPVVLDHVPAGGARTGVVDPSPAVDARLHDDARRPGTAPTDRPLRLPAFEPMGPLDEAGDGPPPGAASPGDGPDPGRTAEDEPPSPGPGEPPVEPREGDDGAGPDGDVPDEVPEVDDPDDASTTDDEGDEPIAPPEAPAPGHVDDAPVPPGLGLPSGAPGEPDDTAGLPEALTDALPSGP